MHARIKLPLLVALSGVLAASAFAVPDKVWVTKSGDKYHLSKSCPALKGAKQVHEVSMSECRKKHITMCKMCQDAKNKKPSPPKAKHTPAKSAPKKH